jgi:hypothetical protein
MGTYGSDTRLYLANEIIDTTKEKTEEDNY